ncbi:MAG: hypothetical protein IJT66_00955 [Clostridia bacterium]|nr:hypothetical protein [Clostridia bacterium]
MKNSGFHPVETFLMRLLWRNRLCGERGTNGAGRWARINKSGISDFYYYFDGTVGGNNFHYRVTEKDNRVLFAYRFMEFPDLKETQMAVDRDVLEQLNQLYLRYRLAAWNGFSKYHQHVCDGSAFSLQITFRDGAVLCADGRNVFPPRYHEFCAAMKALLDPLRDALLNAAKDQKRQKSGCRKITQ